MDASKNGHPSADAVEADGQNSEEVSGYYRETRPDIQAIIKARGKRILDVGCAAGDLGQALKQAGALEVVGIELNPEAAALAKAKIDQVFNENIQTFEPPLPLASFDYIIFADILEHTTDPWAILSNYRRYLKPDGRVILSIPNIRFYAVIARLLFNRWEYHESGILDSTHLRFFTLPTVKEMFVRSGYRVERVIHKYRLFEDQSQIGRIGAVSSKLFCRAFAPWPWRHFFTFQYLVVARPATNSSTPQDS